MADKHPQPPHEPGTCFIYDSENGPQVARILVLDEVAVFGTAGEGQHPALHAVIAELAATSGKPFAALLADPRRMRRQYGSLEELTAALQPAPGPQPEGGDRR